MRPALDCFGEKGTGDAAWKEAHQELQRLAKERAGLDFEEGRWFLVALRSGAHQRFGHGTFSEYIERLFGYGPRFTQEKLRVAEALEELPAMAEELRSGKSSFSAVRELTRVATPGTEGDWLRVARGKTVREVERLVSGHRPGSLPADTPDPGAQRHVLRFEVSGDVLATFREAMAKTRRDAGEPLDDDAALLSLARQVLGGPGDDRRASYQVALTVCENCRKGWQHGRGELVEVSDEVVEMAECDAQHIGNVDSSVDAHVDATGCDHTDAHVDATGCDHTDAHVDATGCDHTDAHAHVDATARVRRAKQTVPPSVRREVLLRDHGRCRVPGCRCATFVDVHHRKPRSEGGRHHSDNLITLCSAHHRALHDGELGIDGPPSCPVFRHADGTPYGNVPSPTAVEALAKAFQGLRNMGYSETKVRAALGKVEIAPEPNLKQILRNALLILG